MGMAHGINRTDGIDNYLLCVCVCLWCVVCVMCVCVWGGGGGQHLFAIIVSHFSKSNWDSVDSLRPSLRETKIDLSDTLNDMAAGDLNRCVARASAAIELT